MFESERTIPTKSGREIRIIEMGQPDGVPVLVHNGTPGSKLLYHPWVEDALARGIRLIGYARAGSGGSTSHPGRAVASVADDVAAIAQALGINRLLVWGISGGGPHALACADLLPDLVAAAAVLASVAPYPAAGLDWFAGMGEDNVEEFNAAIDGRGTLEPMIEAMTSGLLEADPESMAQAFHTLVSPVDAAVLSSDFAAYLLDSIRDGVTETRDGWVDDDLAFTKPWGFELDHIQVPVLLWHGKHDRFVPFAHGEWLAGHISNVDARLSDDDGHLTLALRRVPEVHSWLLAHMA